jgi:hypothetical protein
MLFSAKGAAPNIAHLWNEYLLQQFVKTLSQYKCVIQEECCSEQKVQHQTALIHGMNISHSNLLKSLFLSFESENKSQFF